MSAEAIPGLATAALNRYGSLALIRLAFVLALFVGLRLARRPLVFAARVLLVAAYRADRHVTALMTTPRREETRHV